MATDGRRRVGQRKGEGTRHVISTLAANSRKFPSNSDDPLDAQTLVLLHLAKSGPDDEDGDVGEVLKGRRPPDDSRDPSPWTDRYKLTTLQLAL